VAQGPQRDFFVSKESKSDFCPRPAVERQPICAEADGSEEGRLRLHQSEGPLPPLDPRQDRDAANRSRGARRPGPRPRDSPGDHSFRQECQAAGRADHGRARERPPALGRPARHRSPLLLEPAGHFDPAAGEPDRRPRWTTRGSRGPEPGSRRQDLLSSISARVPVRRSAPWLPTDAVLWPIPRRPLSSDQTARAAA
jgi:hypothetical protein